MEGTHWPFDQPRNCAVFSIVSIIRNGAPILHITHDEDYHGWQFLGKEGARMADAMVVALEEIVDLDDSVLAIADLLPGWHAWRESKYAPWQRDSSLPQPIDFHPVGVDGAGCLLCSRDTGDG